MDRDRRVRTVGLATGVTVPYVDGDPSGLALVLLHAWGESLAGLCAAVPPTDQGTIAAPTLIIWGDGDQFLTRGDEEAMAAAIPGARLLPYEGTGHLVLWEEPERIAADVTDFVATLSGWPPCSPELGCPERELLHDRHPISRCAPADRETAR